MSKVLYWPTARLGSLAAPGKHSIVGGPFGSDLVSSDYTPDGVPVVRGTNLPAGKLFSYEGLVFVSEAKADQLKINSARPGDLVFTQRGTLGQVGIIPLDSPFDRYVISQSQMKVTVDPSKADARYLYYYFVLPSTITYIENHALQSGVPHINLGILKRLEVVLPPLLTQKKIAAILTAYDDLIENNKQRIALLEKMAEEIYREWFVRLRFPGHEFTRSLKGMPKDWQASRIDDLYRTSSGGTPSRTNPDYYKGSVPWVTTGELKEAFVFDTDEKISKRALEASSAKVFPADTIVMAMYCAMDQVSILAQDSATNQACCALLPKRSYVGRAFTYNLVKAVQKELIGWSHGAAQQNLSQQLIRRFPIFDPPEKLVAGFCGKTDAMYEQIKQLGRMNLSLLKTRDLLLGRLISGKLRVDQLDIQFPPSMREST